MTTHTQGKPPLPLSISIVSCNEEQNLERCLSSTRGLAAEIIVIDSGSEDRTVEVACAHGATVIEQEWLGFRDQKNFALEQCTQPWVLALDSDEALSSELRQSIEDFFSKGLHEKHESAACNRMVWFLGRWIKHGDWYPDRKTRLFKRELARWGGSIEHDKIEMQNDQPPLILNGDLLHFSFENMAGYISKINRYADAFLQRKREAGKKWCLISNLTRPPWKFFRAYIMRRGFLDGYPGLWIALATAFQGFIRHSVAYEDRCAKKCPREAIAKPSSETTLPSQDDIKTTAPTVT